MCNIQNNIVFSWQLVSQFVSWDFCRYMCDQDDNSSSETDVLTFLRNMIVQRTEKSVSDITKHEIIAKFIMEAKAILDISRMQCIITLSETVKKICPELDSAVTKLIHHLETFLNVLDYNEESEKRELIKFRIDDAINDFCKEAANLLPVPELLKVVEAWKYHHEKTFPKPTKKIIYNSNLLEKVLECFHFESITPSEAKLIAVALYEDKEFEIIIKNAENEAEADSDQFSFQQSQPQANTFSQEFLKCTQNGLPNEKEPNQPSPSADAFQRLSPLQFPNLQQQVNNLPEEVQDDFLQFTDDPPQLIPMVPLPPQSSNHPNNKSIFEKSFVQRTSDNNKQFAQSSSQESDSDDPPYNLLNRMNCRFNNESGIHIFQNSHDSDSDTSDCEKNPQYKFLTPTLYKTGNKNGAKAVWLSDNESNDSSVVTATCGSQKEDPNWTLGRKATATLAAKNNQNRNTQNRKSGRKTVTVPLVLSDDSSPYSPIYTRPKNTARFPETESDDSVHSIPRFGRKANEPQPSTSKHTDDPPTKKMRRLFRSPNTSIQDFVTRRPVPTTTNAVPVHVGTNTRATKKTPQTQSRKTSSRTKKCKQCSRSYKTVIALRRHVFLEHTAPADGSSPN